MNNDSKQINGNGADVNNSVPRIDVKVPEPTSSPTIKMEDVNVDQLHVGSKPNDAQVAQYVSNSHAVQFDQAFVRSDAFEIECREMEDPRVMQVIATDIMANDLSVIPSLLLLLRDPKLLPAINQAVTNGAPRVINKDTNIISARMLQERIVSALPGTAPMHEAAQLLLTSFITKVLSDWGVVYGAISDRHVRIRNGLLPTWTDLRIESARRLLETAVTSVNTSNILDAKKVSATLLLEPMREVLRNLESSLLDIQSQAKAMNMLGAASVAYLMNVNDNDEAFSGILTIPAVAQAARNYTFVSAYLSELKELSSIGSVLSRAPLVTVRDDMAKALSAITEGGRIKEVALSDFVRNSERAIFKSITDAPLQILIAPKFNLDSVKIQSSMLSKGRRGVTDVMVPMPDIEAGFAGLLSPVMGLVSGGLLRRISNVASYIAANHFSEEKLTCCDGSQLFEHDRPLVAIGADARYVEHMAVATADTTLMKRLFSVDRNSVTTHIDIWDPTVPAIMFQSQRLVKDPARQLQMIDGSMTFVTSSPAVLFAYGTRWSTYEPADSSWPIGTQILASEHRYGSFEGYIKPKRSVENNAYLIPNDAARVNNDVSIVFPSDIMGSLGAKTVTVDMSELMVGVRYDNDLGDIYVHQIPVLRNMLCAYFSFMLSLPYKKGDYNEITVWVASELEDLVTSSVVTSISNNIKTRLMIQADGYDEKAKMAAIFNKQRVDITAAMDVLAELLAKGQLVNKALYQSMQSETDKENIFRSSAVAQHLASKLQVVHLRV